MDILGQISTQSASNIREFSSLYRISSIFLITCNNTPCNTGNFFAPSRLTMYNAVCRQNSWVINIFHLWNNSLKIISKFEAIVNTYPNTILLFNAILQAIAIKCFKNLRASCFTRQIDRSVTSSYTHFLTQLS